MFEVYRIPDKEIILFALMLIRMSGCIATLPIFGNKNVPLPSKVLLSLVLSLILFPVLKGRFALQVSWQDDLIFLAAREALCGIFIGFLARMLFVGVEIAGQILSLTMGFSAVQLINPSFNESGTVLEQFEVVLATLLFLAINGHYMLLEALVKSFELAPLGRLAIDVKGFASMTALVREVFIIGVKLSAPMIAVVLFLNVALGLVGRAVPQVNVFVISFPVNILVGLFVFSVSIPLLLSVMEADFVKIGAEIFKFLRAF